MEQSEKILMLKSFLIFIFSWQKSKGFLQILSRFSADSQQMLSRFSADSRQFLSKFSADSQEIMSRFLGNSQQILSRFSADSQKIHKWSLADSQQIFSRLLPTNFEHVVFIIIYANFKLGQVTSCFTLNLNKLWHKKPWELIFMLLLHVQIAVMSVSMKLHKFRGL